MINKLLEKTLKIVLNDHISDFEFWGTTSQKQ